MFQLFLTARTIYLAYDLSFSYCIDTIYAAMKEYCPTVVKGEIIRSQNLSDSEHFGENYIKLGYHYFSLPERDPNATLLFLAKDNVDVTNYYVNGTLFSVLLDSGLSQAYVFSDFQLRTVVCYYYYHYHYHYYYYLIY